MSNCSLETRLSFPEAKGTKVGGKRLPRVLLLLMLAPIRLSAQQPQPAGTISQGPNPYGTGQQAELNYSGSPLRNLLLVDAGLDTAYADNILNRNDPRIRDMSFRLFPRIALHREGRQFTLALDYQPSFLIYRKTKKLNEWDQTLALHVNYQVSRQLAFRARGALLSTRGIFQPASSGDLVPALGSPGNLNATVLRPLARQLTDSVRLDAVYETSRYTSFTLFGVLAMRNFSQASAPTEDLLNSQERSGGLLYRHRLSPNNTLGVTYLLEDLRVGANTRVVIHSGLFSLGRQINPHFSFNVFGGPQYARLHDVIPALPPSTGLLPIFNAQLHWAVGGELTRRSEKTVIQFTAERQITDGGGLLGPVTSSAVSVDLRQQFAARWQGIWSLSYGHNQNLDTGLPFDRIQSMTARFGLERAWTPSFTAGLGYEFLLQKANGAGSPLANVDRNRVYIRLLYRFAEIGLGR